MSDPISVIVQAPAQVAASVNTTTQPASFASLGGAPADNTALASALSGKQATLVSGTNIKTVNGTSLLGSGDIAIAGGGGGGIDANAAVLYALIF